MSPLIATFPLPLMQSSQSGYGEVKAIGLVGQTSFPEATPTFWSCDAAQFWISFSPFPCTGSVCSTQCRFLLKESQPEATCVPDVVIPLLGRQSFQWFFTWIWTTCGMAVCTKSRLKWKPKNTYNVDIKASAPIALIHWSMLNAWNYLFV